MKSYTLKHLYFAFLSIFVFLCSCKKEYADNYIKSGSLNKSNSSNLMPLANVNLSEYVFFGGDEFNGNSLDTNVWYLRRENDPTDPAPNIRSNISVGNGFLTLITKAPPVGSISRSEISTKPIYSFRYGYFEIRAQLSSGAGNSCAFWLQTPLTNVVSDPFNPALAGAEIDIFENGISQGVDKLFYSLHWNGYIAPQAKFVTAIDYIPGVYSGFHTFALEWTPKKYTIYVDGIQRIVSDTIISRTPEFIVLGLGPGGFGGSTVTNPNPSSFIVDYIHVYNRRQEVTLYGDWDYKGWISNGLLPGSYTTTQLTQNGFVNNDLTSIEIPVGWKVTLFDKDNFTGDSIVLSNGDATYVDYMDNRTSSMRIVKN